MQVNFRKDIIVFACICTFKETIVCFIHWLINLLQVMQGKANCCPVRKRNNQVEEEVHMCFIVLCTQTRKRCIFFFFLRSTCRKQRQQQQPGWLVPPSTRLAFSFWVLLFFLPTQTQRIDKRDDHGCWTLAGADKWAMTRESERVCRGTGEFLFTCKCCWERNFVMMLPSGNCIYGLRVMD